MPEYLLADVTFGRRQRPDLDVRVTAKRNEDGPLVLFDLGAARLRRADSPEFRSLDEAQVAAACG